MKSKTIICLWLFLLVSNFLFAQGGENEVKTGKASYYGRKFHKKRTASGISYDHNAYTCAHKDFPFGTKLVVRNPFNDKKVVVEVTDRGPFRRGRIIDLSWIAAKELDIIRHGIATVEVSEYIEPSKNVYDIPRLTIKTEQLLSVEKSQTGIAGH